MGSFSPRMLLQAHVSEQYWPDLLKQNIRLLIMTPLIQNIPCDSQFGARTGVCTVNFAFEASPEEYTVDDKLAACAGLCTH